MKTLLKGISYAGLLATVIPSILVWMGTIRLETNKIIMIIGMVMWFATAPFTTKK